MNNKVLQILNDYSPEEGNTRIPTIERLSGETLDQAIARKVGYQIDNGKVRLEEIHDGWKAQILDYTGTVKTIQGYSKQAVLNNVWMELNK